MSKIIMISLLALTVFVSCGNKSEDGVSGASSYNSDSNKEALPVFTQKAVEEPFYTSVDASGIIEGIRESDIISETSGLITTVFFEIGDFVKEGDILLKVEDRVAAISYESAKQDFESARLEFDALQKSFQTGGSSQLILSQGRARLEAARLRMEQSGDILEDTSIKAPFDGFISTRDISISAGSYLQIQQPVTRIINNSSFRIRLSLGEDEIPLIQKGDDAVVVLNSLPELNILAEIDAVSPGSSRSGGGFPVVLSWEDESGGSVKSGMSATVRIKPDKTGINELIIPSSSIVRRNGQNYVFRVNNNQAEAIEVTVIQSLGERTSISETPGAGLFVNAGDELIVTGLNSLIPGDPVIPSLLEEKQ